MSHARRDCAGHPPVGGLFVSWEVTAACNLTCAHCFASSSPQADTSNELSTDQVLSLGEHIITHGATELGLAGGEPFMVPGFADLLESIGSRESDCGIRFVTNGYLLTPALVEQLSRANIEMCYVSLDGHTPVVHAMLRGKTSAFAKAVRGIELLASAGITFGINHVIHRRNVEYLASFMEFALAFAPHELVVSPLTPAGRGVDLLEDVLTEDMVSRAEETVQRMAATPAAAGVKVVFGGAAAASNADSFVCGAGHEILMIGPTGEVYPYPYLNGHPEYRVGNVKEEAFDELLGRARTMMTPMPTRCLAFGVDHSSPFHRHAETSPTGSPQCEGALG